jgi:hypothetical protein
VSQLHQLLDEETKLATLAQTLQARIDT